MANPGMMVPKNGIDVIVLSRLTEGGGGGYERSVNAASHELHSLGVFCAAATGMLRSIFVRHRNFWPRPSQFGHHEKKKGATRVRTWVSGKQASQNPL